MIADRHLTVARGLSLGQHLSVIFQYAASQVTDADRRLLLEHGVQPDDFHLIGRLDNCRISPLRRHRYDPAPEGGEAFVTPVRVETRQTPESPAPRRSLRDGPVVDLVAWHPMQPDRWALRRGTATVLGLIPPQYLRPDPVQVRTSVLDWFRHHCTGSVLLTTSRSVVYRELSLCRGGIRVDNHVHAAQLRRMLSRPWPAPRVSVDR